MPRFSIKTLLLICTIVAVIVAVWLQNMRTRSHADSVQHIKCTAYYSHVLPRSLGWIFGFHFVARVTDVELRFEDFQTSYMRPEMNSAELDDHLFETLKGLPNLKTVWLFDYTSERVRYKHVKSKLTNVNVVNFPDYPDSRPSLANGMPFSILHAFRIAAIMVLLFKSLEFVCDRSIRFGR